MYAYFSASIDFYASNFEPYNIPDSQAMGSRDSIEARTDCIHFKLTVRTKTLWSY